MTLPVLSARTWLAIRFAALPFIAIVPFFTSKTVRAACKNMLTPEYSFSTHQPTGKMAHTAALHIDGPPAFFGALFF